MHTDRYTNIHTHRYIHVQTDRSTHRHTHWQTQTWTDTHRGTRRGTHRHTQVYTHTQPPLSPLKIKDFIHIYTGWLVPYWFKISNHQNWLWPIPMLYQQRPGLANYLKSCDWISGKMLSSSEERSTSEVSHFSFNQIDYVFHVVSTYSLKQS